MNTFELVLLVGFVGTTLAQPARVAAPLPPFPALTPDCGISGGDPNDCFDDNSQTPLCSQWCFDTVNSMTIIEECSAPGTPGLCGAPFTPPSLTCSCLPTPVILCDVLFYPVGRCYRDCSCADGDFFETTSGCKVCTDAGVFPPNGMICIDPHFKTLSGNKHYDFHGLPDRVFNILSTPTSQLNSRFVTFGHKNDTTMKHHHTFLGEIGFQSGKDRVHFFSDTCAPTFNGEDFSNSQVSTNSMIAVHRMMSEEDEEVGVLEIVTMEWSINIYCNWRNDLIQYFNLDVSYRPLPDSTQFPAGVLGETAEPKDWHPIPGAQQGEGIVQGSLRDYEIQENDVFGVQFSFNQFNAENEPATLTRTK